MPSPMGRVAPKGSGEVQQTLPSIEILSANPYCGRTSSAPAASRWGTFPKGEGFFGYKLFTPFPQKALAFSVQLGYDSPVSTHT